MSRHNDGGEVHFPDPVRAAGFQTRRECADAPLPAGLPLYCGIACQGAVVAKETRKRKESSPGSRHLEKSSSSAGLISGLKVSGSYVSQHLKEGGLNQVKLEL
jgi:hypothetical protein